MVTASEPRELVIVGGGPAGMAAALEAESLGVSACILDERPTLGGQIYKRLATGVTVRSLRQLGREYNEGGRMISAVEKSGADIRTSTVVWGIWDRQVAYVRESRNSGVIDAQCVILATGAFDRPVAFPGWTLPGVMMAGGAKSLAQTQGVLPGRRILVAGSGPLILALSAELQKLGAHLVLVVEAASRPGVASALRLAARARGNEVLLADAIRYWTRLFRHQIPFMYSSMVVRAEGDGQVQQAIVARVDKDWHVVPGTETKLKVDTICLGYGFQASSELSRLCGCRQRFDEDQGGYIPVRDEWMRTTVPGVLAAGDGSGIGGSRIAIEEGRLAGIAAAIELGRITRAQAADRARPIRRRLRLMQRFREILEDMYRVGPGSYDLATADTIVCRCEDVTAGELERIIAADDVADPNVVKSLTRAGMGLCQGRMCARQVGALIARHTGVAIAQVRPAVIRPPVEPVLIGAIADERVEVPLTADVS